MSVTIESLKEEQRLRRYEEALENGVRIEDLNYEVE